MALTHHDMNGCDSFWTNSINDRYPKNSSELTDLDGNQSNAFYILRKTGRLLMCRKKQHVILIKKETSEAAYR